MNCNLFNSSRVGAYSLVLANGSYKLPLKKTLPFCQQYKLNEQLLKI